MNPQSVIIQKEQGKERLARNESRCEGNHISNNQDTSAKIWRPWIETPMEKLKKCSRFEPYCRQPPTNCGASPGQSLLNTFQHPVRLYWTKAAYDYMYEAGEKLLRNFPVQATIQLVEDSDSDESEDDEEELDEDSDENNDKK